MEGVILSYKIYKPSYFSRLFVKNYLKHTWNNLLFSHVFQKKARLLTRSALWLLFHVLKRVTFRTSPAVHYQNFMQSSHIALGSFSFINGTIIRY